MKKIYKLFALMLSFAVLCSINAYAMAPTSTNTEAEDTFILVRGEPIGSLEDDEGFSSQNVETRTTATTGLPFSMTATGVHELLTTKSSGKSFTGGAFDALVGEGLLMTGSLTHTEGRSVKAGACYYEASNDTFSTVKPLYFDSGESIEAWIPKISGHVMYFGNSTTYYGHVTNAAGSGTISGNLHFSVSTSPW